VSWFVLERAVLLFLPQKVSLGVMTALAGFLGMNLELPLWLDGGFTSTGPGAGGGAFVTVCAASGVIGSGIYGFGLAHANGRLRAMPHGTVIACHRK
jgi:hypothetical protein